MNTADRDKAAAGTVVVDTGLADIAVAETAAADTAARKLLSREEYRRGEIEIASYPPIGAEARRPPKAKFLNIRHLDLNCNVCTLAENHQVALIHQVVLVDAEIFVQAASFA